MAKGKGRRRRMSNYLAAHGGEQYLPPSPATQEIAAVPSKLRRIMALKASSHNTCEVSSTTHKSETRSQNEVKALKGNHVSETGKGFTMQGLNNEDESSVKQSGEAVLQKKRKRKREEGLHFLMDKLKASTVQKGLNERKKRYLKEKQRKKRKLGNSTSSEVFNGATHQHEAFHFGEVVNAPPKLSFPRRKDTGVWEQRIREQAIANYRQKKKWLSRPGSHQPPSLPDSSINNS